MDLTERLISALREGRDGGRWYGKPRPAEPAFASESAMMLPCRPLWPGIQWKEKGRLVLLRKLPIEEMVGFR